jgi:hypothetical protein
MKKSNLASAVFIIVGCLTLALYQIGKIFFPHTILPYLPVIWLVAMIVFVLAVAVAAMVTNKIRLGVFFPGGVHNQAASSSDPPEQR